MTARSAYLGLFIALVVLAQSTPLLARQTRSLPEPQRVPLHSSVEVSALATVRRGHDVGPTQATVQPRRQPDPAGLRLWKDSLRQAPDGSLAAPDSGEDPALAAVPPEVTAAFEGLANIPDNALAGVSVVPSDATLAVGPGHVFQVVNVVGRITDKSGAAVSTFPLRSFFQLDAGASETDPRIIYDAASQRWFATILQSSSATQQSSVVLAVSASSDPTGTFCLFRLGNPSAESFIQDFPHIGIDDQKVIVTYVGFRFPDETFLGSGYYALNKADLVQSGSTGCQPLSVPSVRVPPDLARYGVYPAQSLSSTGRLYMAMSGGFSPSSELVLLAVDGQPGVTDLTEDTTVLPIRLWRPPPDAVQAGSQVRLATNDASVITAVWQRGSLWLGGNEACVPGGDGLLAFRSCLRLIQIRTDLLTVQQDITFGTAGQYYYYPALGLDAAGNLFVVFNSSSASESAGVRTTGRRATDPPDTLIVPTLLRAGGGAQTGSGRMGDYYGAALDPADPGKVWVTAEYIRTTGPRGWGTYVAQLMFNPVPPPTVDLTLNAHSFQPGDPVQLTLTVGNPAPALVVDVYFGILLPAEAGPALGCPLGDAIAFSEGGLSSFVIRCASASPASFPPFATATSIPAELPPTLVPDVFSVASPSGPGGVYVFFVAFTVPAALAHGSIGPGDILVLATASVTLTP